MLNFTFRLRRKISLEKWRIRFLHDRKRFIEEYNLLYTMIFDEILHLVNNQFLPGTAAFQNIPANNIHSATDNHVL